MGTDLNTLKLEQNVQNIKNEISQYDVVKETFSFRFKFQYFSL